MRGTLIRSALIQSLGVVATFVITLGVANLGGPDTQGRFATLKSIHDVLITLLALGLPSGIVYVIRRGLAGPRRVLSFSLQYSLFLIIPTIGFTYLALQILLPELSVAEHRMTTMVMALAVTAGVAFAIVRALVLTENDGAGFATASILPSVLLVPAIFVAVSEGLLSMSSAYLVADSLALLIAYSYARRLIRGRSSGVPLTASAKKVLASQSGHVFLQGLFFGAQPLVTIFLLQTAGATHDLVGQFNLASLVLTAPNLLIAMVAPILLNRWAAGLDPERLPGLLRRIVVASAAVQLAFLACVPLAPGAVFRIVGSEFEPSAAAAQILTLAALPLCVTRLVGPALQGLGRTGVLTWSGLARLTTIAVSALLLQALNPLTWAAVAWVLAEYVALLVILVGVRCDRASRHLLTTNPR